jgi:hypothetical protein
MARHAIKRATPRADFTVAIEWADGSSNEVDFRPAVFPHRPVVQPAGESLSWETSAGLIDFHADGLWQRTCVKPVAAE